VAGAAIVEEDVAILRPELVADGILLILAEAGTRLAPDEIQEPDALRHQVPRPFVAEHPQRRVVGRELEVAELVRVLEDIKPAGTIQIGERDAAILDAVVAFLEPGIIRAVLDVGRRLLVAAEGHVLPVGRDRRHARDREGRVLLVDGDRPAARQIQHADVVRAGRVGQQRAVRRLGEGVGPLQYVARQALDNPGVQVHAVRAVLG